MLDRFDYGLVQSCSGKLLFMAFFVIIIKAFKCETERRYNE